MTRITGCYHIPLDPSNQNTPPMRSVLNERGVWLRFEIIKKGK